MTLSAAMSQKTVEKPRTKVKPATQRPPLWKVILLNDDFTPREFVVQVLKAVFRMNETHVSFPKIPSGTDSRREAESSHHSDRCL
jgi:ATP-dependent Clp protease adapter protein ClpS